MDTDYASCKDICIPYRASLDLVLPSGLAQPGTEAPLITVAQRRVPEDISAAQWKLLGTAVGTERGNAALSVRLASLAGPFASPDLFVEGLVKGSAGRPEVSLADAGRTASLRVPIFNEAANTIAGTKLRITIVDGARAGEADITPQFGSLAPIPPDATLGAILGIALLGGLILNLMPCVLPVLSLKLLALSSYAGAERRIARMGLLATAAGVILSFGVLAGALIALKAAGAAIGWGIQFQQPWFLAGMALITTLFAASLWGWLPIGLPASITSAVGSVHGRGRLANAFLMGAFATLLAASCSAPFVGTAIGFALARAPLDIALVFGALGLGMAAPFLAVAALPGLIAHLPRPGRWMVWLERALGLALLGTAAWLLSVLALEAGVKIAVAAAAMLALILAAVAWRHRLSADGSARGVVGIAALMLTSLVVLLPLLRGEALSIGPARSASDTQQWQAFDEEALHRIVSDGKLVFVDVTAAWCQGNRAKKGVTTR